MATGKKSKVNLIKKASEEFNHVVDSTCEFLKAIFPHAYHFFDVIQNGDKTDVKKSIIKIPDIQPEADQSK